MFLVIMHFLQHSPIHPTQHGPYECAMRLGEKDKPIILFNTTFPCGLPTLLVTRNINMEHINFSVQHNQSLNLQDTTLVSAAINSVSTNLF